MDNINKKIYDVHFLSEKGLQFSLKPSYIFLDLNIKSIMSYNQCVSNILTNENIEDENYKNFVLHLSTKYTIMDILDILLYLDNNFKFNYSYNKYRIKKLLKNEGIIKNI